MGKPAGWGSVWLEQNVKAGEVSDPYIMTGFDQKVVHLKQTANAPVIFTIEVDFVGDGGWARYDTIAVPADGYRHHEFPAGFSAHWVRVKASRDCCASVTFIYR